MKISPNTFTNKHKMKALKRIFRAFLFGKINKYEWKKYYVAMLHLECYLDRLNSI